MTFEAVISDVRDGKFYRLPPEKENIDSEFLKAVIIRTGASSPAVWVKSYVKMGALIHTGSQFV